MRYMLFPMTRFFSLLLSFGAVLWPLQGVAVAADNEVGRIRKSSDKIEHQVDSVFATLSLREKVAQLFIVDFSSTQSPRMKAVQERLVKNEKVGGLITMKDKVVPAMQRLNFLSRLASVPMLISIDGEWGASMRYGEIPPFPRQMQLGALSSDSLVYKMGYAIGKECRSLKIHVNYAPDVDINNNPDNPAINTRSFGEDKEKVAQYGAAYMMGMKGAGVAGSAKHFPGHGDTDVDSHKGLPELPFTLERLESLELYPFRHLIDKGVDMVMVGHLGVPALDSSGRPASISKPIITDFLKGKMGYDGIVCTDALNMDGVAKSCGLEKKHIPLEAYKAGADILLMAEDVENAITEIENALKKGDLSEAELDGRVKKVLRLKATLGLFERGYSPYVNMYNLEKRVVNRENIELINKLAKHTVTVVTNTGGMLLPLKDINNKKIAYLGYRGEKFGKEFAQTLMKYASVDTLILRSPVRQGDLERARQKLSGYDLIITGFNNTDFRSQVNFGIDSVQMEFLTAWAAEQPMIAVYFGSPYALNKISGYKNFKAFVVGYTNTLANNFAAAQILFGGTPAIGVLPVGTAGHKVGESVILPEQTRLGYYDFEDKGGEYFVQEGMVRGADSVGRVPLLLHETSALLTVIPLVAELIEQGKIKTTNFLGDILSLPMDKHDHILISDLLNHRSGLPPVGDRFNFTQESILNLKVDSKVLPEYSAANIYYLYKILELFYNDVNAEVLRNSSALLASLEMNNSSIKEGMKIGTTLEDLSKFIFMIHNGGRYGGKQVLSPGAAKLIDMLLPYYSKNAAGLKISQDKERGFIKYSR